MPEGSLSIAESATKSLRNYLDKYPLGMIMSQTFIYPLFLEIDVDLKVLKDDYLIRLSLQATQAIFGPAVA